MEQNSSLVLDQEEPEQQQSPRRVLTGCFLSLLILTTLLGNTLVCVAVARFRHLRSKVTNLFVISLALSDLLVAVLVMPWKAATEMAGSWPFGAPFCSVWVACDIMCSTASILHLCVISLDRYWAISSPFRYQRKMTPRLACLMIGAAWTLSLLVSFIPVQLDWHKAQQQPQPPGGGTNSSLLDLDQDLLELQQQQDDCDFNLNRTYAISSSLISFYIPVAIMLVTYTRIYRIAHQQIRRISALERAAAGAHSRLQSSGGGGAGGSVESESSFKVSFKRETKVLKTLSVIMGVFVCCWLPFFILNCIVPFCEAEPPAAACISSTTFDIFVWFGWANSSLNPVIYAFNADFRRAFSTLLGCHRLCPGGADPPDVDPDLPDLPDQYRPKTLIPQESNNHCSSYVTPHNKLVEGEATLEKIQPIMLNGRSAAHSP